MFIYGLSTLIGLITVYLWKRLVRDTIRPGRARRVLGAGLFTLTALLAATLIVPRVTGRLAAPWFAWPGYLWLGLLAYLFMALLALEPVRFVLRGWVKRTPAEPVVTTATEPTTTKLLTEEAPAATAVERRVFLARASAVVAGAVSVSVVGFGAARALGPPDVLQVPVGLRRLAPAFNGFRIAVVSDIHLGSLLGRAHTERIVRMINEAGPDMVAIVGDLVDGSVGELGAAVAPLRDLTSSEGTFFVTGNHEYHRNDTFAWLRELEGHGIQLLRNENTEIWRGASSFGLAGVNDVSGDEKSEPPDFDRALSGLDASRPTILLAHQPVQVEEAAARGVDLQLSGHTHGGQMWPFQYAVAAAHPSLAGLSTVNDTQLYVTRGAGFWGPPVRVGAPPDITVLTLHGTGDT